MEIIKSNTNSRVKFLEKLHQKKYRDEYSLFLIEEEHLIQEALKKGIVEELLILEKEINIFDFDNIVYVSDNVINKLKTNKSNIKYIGVCKKLEYKLNLKSRVLLLDRIQDPSNLGSIIRSALAFGFNQIICSCDCVDLYNEKTIRTSQGSMFHLDILSLDLKKAVDILRKEKFKIYSLALKNSKNLNELAKSDKMCFVLGNEGNGISFDILNLSDEIIKIEMSNFDSLNVSIAAAIVMYKYRL